MEKKSRRDRKFRIAPDVYVSPLHAHVHNHPFGRRGRCWQRIWIETAIKGAKNGLQRIVKQTTKQLVDVEHGQKWSEVDPDQKRELMLNDFNWNNPKQGTYYGLIVLLEDAEDPEFVDHVALPDFASRVHLESVKTTVETAEGTLSTRQVERYNSILRQFKKS